MDITVSFDTGNDPFRAALAPQWAAIVARRVHELDAALRRAVASDPHELGRWEGEGGAAVAGPLCGAVDDVCGGFGPVCTELAGHGDDHVAVDSATGYEVSRWENIRGVEVSRG